MKPPADLIAKWRTRAPRYTSYPTAPHFHPIDADDVDAALRRNTGPFAVYVHIPFCEQRCLYCGCHIEIQGKREVAGPYVDALLAEARLLAERTGDRFLTQLSLGGGTPTFLLPEQLDRLIGGLPWKKGGDIAIEVDPRSVDDAYLDHLVGLGFNRFSFGVQDFDPEVLHVVNRDQPVDLTERAVARLRSHADFDLNFDLVYGLPQQTPEKFAETVRIVAELRPTRIALFQYAHVPWIKPAQKLLERYDLPDSDRKAAMFDVASETFLAAGYEPVGMDHFALPGDALLSAQAAGTLQRNFEGYTTHGGLDLLGLGVSSIGSFGNIYAQDMKDRARWSSEILAGRLPVERGFVLSDDDLRRRRIIMDLFCNFHARVDVAADLDPLLVDGFVEVDGEEVRVTPLGRHFIRNVCAVFDRYLEADPTQRRYSATA